MTQMIPEEILSYEKEIYDLRQLLEISRALNSMLDFEYLIQAVLDMCLAQVQTLQAALFLANNHSEDSISIVSGFNWQELERDPSHYAIPLDSGIIRFLGVHHQALLIKRIERELEQDPSVLLLREMGAELIVPLRSRGRLIGLIVLGEKAVGGGDYPENEQNFLIDLANLAGIAVENARLYESATTDRMTGLRNFAFFQSRVKEDMDRCIRRGRFFSLVIVDVDFFKKFNDTHGHQAGDAVLKRVAEILSEVHRETKEYTAARYGGEEFCLILPGASENQAYQVADRVRRSIEKERVAFNGHELQVTISAGVSTIDYEELRNIHEDEILGRADRALYEAKRSGRNQVLCYSSSMDVADNEPAGGEDPGGSDHREGLHGSEKLETGSLQE